MKQLIVSLGILGMYMLADTGLTAYGLNLGFQEMNPIVNTDKLIQHTALFFALIVVDAFAIYAVEKYIGWKNIARSAILFIATFYVYVLIHNLWMIWRYV